MTFGGDADTFRKVIDTLIQCEIVATKPYGKSGVSYVLAAKDVCFDLQK